MADNIDRGVYLARSGRPHNPAISHLEETHSVPGTAGCVLQSVAGGRKDPDLLRMLEAMRACRDADPESPTHGCLKWYLEDPAVYDTNASFFTCFPLSVLFLFHREQLSDEELAGVRALFRDVLPWFRKMAVSPSLFYPNKCLSDAAMLVAAGHVLEDPEVLDAGRAFCRRYFDYYAARGTGWGEDHSPVYTRVLVEMTLLIMALEKSGALYDQARAMTDAILDWLAFHDGLDAVPSIRGYNFECRMEVGSPILSLIEGRLAEEPRSTLVQLADACGYRFRAPELPVPRQRRWRAFDEHYSTSYVGEHARLGTLSHYPLMPNAYAHDEWGLGWQSKPASFIVHGEEYGVLEWMTEDDEGVVRQHESAGGMHDWASRHLFKRISFHPEVVFAGHQEGRAAILFREIHRVHSPTRRVADRWRLSRGAGRILVGGREWDGTPLDAAADWVVLQYAHTCVAIRPLKCRVPDLPDEDRNPQRRLAGNLVDLGLRIERGERGVTLSLPLVEGHDGVLTQHLLFSGWCVALIDRPEDVAGLSVTETLDEDGEVPRTYGELIRTVELTTPEVTLKLVRDTLTGDEERFTDGRPFPGPGRPDGSPTDEALGTLFRRRSVRRFDGRPVEPGLIRGLLEAAMAAPTACNSQPWEFVVVTDAEVLDRLRSRLLFARYNAPCAIAVCGNPEIANGSTARQYWVQDCSAAMENLLIAAAGLGLGAVWIGVHPLPSVIKPVREVLNLPEHVQPLGIAMVGHPAEGAVPGPRTQYDERRVHWQLYEPRKRRAKLKNAKHHG